MSIRVMTYNVRYFANLARLKGMHSTRSGVEAIASAIANLDELPHVVGLQEVEAKSLRSGPAHQNGESMQIQVLMKALEHALEQADKPHRYEAHYFPAHVYGVKKAKLYTTGLALLVRSDVRVHRQSRYDITHRSRYITRHLKQSRICAHLRIGAPDDISYDIFNTHLSLPAFFPNNFYRIPSRMGFGNNQLEEVQALGRFVAEHRNGDRYVVMGDFNTLPASPAYDMLQDTLHVHDPFPDLLGMSLDDVRADFPTAGFLRYRMRLDHIFAGPELRWLDYEDTHPFGDLEGRWEGLSDHVPILGRFRAR